MRILPLLFKLKGSSTVKEFEDHFINVNDIKGSNNDTPEGCQQKLLGLTRINS